MAAQKGATYENEKVLNFSKNEIFFSYFWGGMDYKELWML